MEDRFKNFLNASLLDYDGMLRYKFIEKHTVGGLILKNLVKI